MTISCVITMYCMFMKVLVFLFLYSVCHQVWCYDAMLIRCSRHREATVL